MYRNVKGALEPDMEIELTINGSVVDISDAISHTLRWLLPDGTLNATAALVPGTGGLEVGRVKRVWAEGDTDVVGYHLATVEVTRGNGELQVFPSNGTTIKWRIFARLGE